MNITTNEQIREHIEHLMTLTVQYAEEKITRDHLDSIHTAHDGMNTDITQLKSYVLNLEQKMSALEADNTRIKEDLNQAGTLLANLSEENKSLRSIMEAKKGKFWNRK